MLLLRLAESLYQAEPPRHLIGCGWCGSSAIHEASDGLYACECCGVWF